MHLLCLCMEVRMFWQRFLLATWEVGTVPSSWTTPQFISGCLRLMKRCLQWTVASVFGSLDPISMTEVVVNRLRGAETMDWTASCPALRKAIFTSDLSMPGMVDVVANFAWVWAIVVSYLKETGRKEDGVGFVVSSSFVVIFFASLECTDSSFAV